MNGLFKDQLRDINDFHNSTIDLRAADASRWSSKSGHTKERMKKRKPDENSQTG